MVELVVGRFGGGVVVTRAVCEQSLGICFTRSEKNTDDLCLTAHLSNVALSPQSSQ